jgi:hypothetical protein
LSFAIGWPGSLNQCVTLKANLVSAALEKKGFSCENTKHHYVYWFVVNDRKTSINTKISHGEKEIGSPLISAMSRQVRLTKDEFLALVACPLTAEKYLEKMTSEGHVRL